MLHSSLKRLLFFCRKLMISYLVSEFAKGELSNLVKECFGTEFPDIFRKSQIDYIYRYLNDLDAESVLLEPQYIDKDYLEDFNHYYVKCFGNSGFVSARLHFFSKKLDHQKMTEYLATGDQDSIKSLQDSYLGFVVIKPLTKTFIGKTCLRAYPSINQKNGLKKCLSRNYSVDLFGIPLNVNSVAFQEQDKVISACATTAIWSSLHAMYWKNVREIPSCSEITTNAINHIRGSSNSFPNRDLSNKQICRALDFEKLKYHIKDISASSADDFFSIVKTYIDSKIPLILGVDVYKKNGESLSRLDGHAVSIVGYKIADDPSHRAIYVHDDRLGPFARAQFIELKEAPTQTKVSWGLVVQQKDDSKNWVEPHEVFVLNTLIAATPQKVRLPPNYTYETCNHIVSGYEDMISNLETKLGKDAVSDRRNKLTFEVKLSEISEIRQELFNQKYIGNKSAFLEKEKVRFLTKNYARYHWIASFKFDKKPIFKILFDATDIPQGNAISSIFVEDYDHTEFVLEANRKFTVKDITLTDIDSTNFYGAFLRYIKPKPKNLSSHLDEYFGELRAPKYIKNTEMNEGDILSSKVDEYYCSIEQKIEDKYPDIIAEDPNSFLIWTISSEGTLLIGREESGKGHPTLTRFKPSRIAGELRLAKNNIWKVNTKSGRYSTDYSNTNDLLSNAVQKIKDIFQNSKDSIEADPYLPNNSN